VPTYQYRCTQCGNQLEIVQKFTDPALTQCDRCDGALRKVYNAVGVVFKGSGFYRTDSRAGGDGKGAAGSKTAEKVDKAATGSSSNGSSSSSDVSGANGASGSDKKPAAASSTAG
jgi:putative FmdB family regulatory protein